SFEQIAGGPFLYIFTCTRRHTSRPRDWSSDVCSSDLDLQTGVLRLVDQSSQVGGSVTGAAGTTLYLIGVALDDPAIHTAGAVVRSEERRVGKECRSGRTADP